MYRELIRQRDYAQETSIQFRHGGPEAEPIVLLRLEATRGLDHTNAHFACQIRPLSQNPFLEIGGEIVIRHRCTLAGVTRQGKPCEPENELSHRWRERARIAMEMFS